MKRKFIFLFTLVFMLFVLSSCSSSKVRLKDLLDENREMYSKLSEYHSFIKTEIYFYDENSGECNSLNLSSIFFLMSVTLRTLSDARLNN